MRGVNSTNDIAARHWEDARYWNTDLWLDDDGEDDDWRNYPAQEFPAVDEWAALTAASAAVTSWAVFVAGQNPQKHLLAWRTR